MPIREQDSQRYLQPHNALPPGTNGIGLPRRLSTGSATMLVIGMVIGTGIFRTPAGIAQAIDSAGLIAVLWIAGGVLTLCLALCLAELATRYPHPGGLYVYLREGYGPGVAFVFGWMVLLVTPAVSAAIALIFVESLAHFVSLGAHGKRYAATVLILFVTAANYRSVRFAVRLQSAATSAKCLALLAISGAAFAFGDGTMGALAQAQRHEPSFTPATLAGAFLAVLFAYEGVGGSCAAFGEVRNPARALPRALLGGVVAVILLYVLINAAYLYVLPIDDIAKSPLVATDAMRVAVGARGAAAISLCVMLSALGTLASAAIANPRILYAMALDGLFLRRIGAVHPRYHTPYLAVAVSGLPACAFVWLQDFEELIAQYLLGLWPFLALTVLALIRIRRRSPDAKGTFRTPAYPLMALVVVIATVGVLLGSAIEVPRISLINATVLLLGSLFYWIWKRSTS